MSCGKIRLALRGHRVICFLPLVSGKPYATNLLMIIGPFSLSEWTAQRYELSYEGSRLGNYTAWDIIRLFDEGQITEDSMMAAVGYPTVGRFAEGYLFKHKDELRALNGALGQVIMIDLLTKIRWSLVAIALIAALTLINGLFYFIRIW